MNSHKKLIQVDFTTYDKNMTNRNASFLLEGTFAEGSRHSVVPRLFITGDFNGDGKHELVTVSGYKMPKGETRTWSRTTMFNLESRTKIYDQTPFLFDYFNVYLNRNGRLNTTAISEKITIPSDAHFITGNIGDVCGYRTSQLLSIKDATVTPISFTRNDARERMLSAMVNSYGVVEKTEYANLTDGSVYWTTSSYTTNFPYNKLYMDVNFVSSTSSMYDNKHVSSKSYNYNDAVIHRQGLGFTGFRKIIMYDNIKGMQTEMTFDPTKFGVATQMVSPTSEASYIYSATVAANKIAKVTLNSKTEKDKLKNITVSSNYIYDTYGNVTKETVNYGDGLIVTTNNTYNNTDNASTYRIGILSDQITTKTKGSSTWIERKNIPSFSNLLPDAQKHIVNGKQISLTSYSYKDGLVIRESLKEYTSDAELITTYEYDSFGRIIKKTDPARLSETYTYNLKGQLSITKNHKDQETSFSYDDFGRKVKTTKPDGSIETTSLSWSTTPASALWLSTVSVTGSPTSQTYYDAFGREVRTGKQRFDGNYVYTDNMYDEKGRLSKVSMPFKGTTPTQWNVYAYDTYDRITSLKYASGKEDTFSYSGTSITSTIDGISKTEKHDAAGNIISVTDPAGTITYNYRPDGQLDNIVAPESITTSFQYDDYGRQISMTDPSFGTIKYAYDAAGNVNTETYADGNITKKTYDKHHRLTKKEVAGQTITYTYNADNLIASEVSSNGTSKTYEYDDLMRLKTLKETNVDGKWLQKTYAYNGGNVSSLTYASNTGNIVTENYTYSYGNLSEVKLNNTTSIWKLTGENALGQPTGVSTGYLTRTYSYDTYGYPTGRVVKNGSTVIQNFGYSFNAKTGNLNWRKDNVRNIQENFGYDNLNRLTSFSGKTVTYSNNGNITDISNVGSFAYDEERPYAVAFITPYGTSVPLREQQITYNGLKRPETITENGYVATFTYNGEGNRVKMNLKKNNQVQLNKYYWGNQYEVETGVAGSKEILYLGGDAYSAAAAYVKEGTGAWNIYYLCGDYLGSITHIVNSSGGVKQELSYDAWGRLRNPANQSLYADGAEPALFLGRGYTGHEHLTVFGLINMNARLYDPVIGRFLSPDPQLQEPYSSQNFNRYSYCLNNPLRYVDENGEFFFGLVAGFFRGLFSKKPWKAFEKAWKGAVNEVKIFGGLFVTGSYMHQRHRSFWVGAWELISRFTWQLPQTIIGYGYTQISGYAGQVDRVDYWGGATVTSGNNWGQKAVTLSNFIIGDHTIAADPNNPTFQHEYGHYLQSQSMGWAYLSRIGIPSLLSADGTGNHKFQSHEQDANARAFLYFNEYVPGFYQTEEQYDTNKYKGIGWNFKNNPLDINHKKESEYRDYNNSQIREAIKGLKIKEKWYDHASWGIPMVGGAIGIGIYNSKRSR